jgi:hypothetical protein
VNTFDIPIRQDPLVEHIGKIVDHAIAPFEPGQILVFQSNSDTYDIVLQVTVENLRKWPFRTTLSIQECLLGPSELTQLILDRVFRHFRYRPSLPVDDHIQLGED